MSATKSSLRSWDFWVKAGLLGALAAILAALIGLIPSFIEMRTPVIQIQQEHLFFNGWLNTDINGERYSVIPLECLAIGGEALDYISPGESYGSISFVIHPSKPNVLLEMFLILEPRDSVESNMFNITELQITPSDIGIGGPILPISLDNIVIESDFESATLTKNSMPYQFDFGAEDLDSKRFILPFVVRDPGEYNFQIEVHAEADSGKSIDIQSESIIYKAVPLDNYDQIAVTGMGRFTGLPLETCP